MDKIEVSFHSKGESGNIYWILAKCRKALEKARRIIEYNNMWERVQDCTSYADALAVVRKYVDLIDLDGRY